MSATNILEVRCDIERCLRKMDLAALCRLDGSWEKLGRPMTRASGFQGAYL